MDYYNSLELKEIIIDISNYCSFSLSKKLIENLKLEFNPLIINRNINLTKDALNIITKYNAIPFLGFKDILLSLDNVKKEYILNTSELLDIASINDNINNIIRYTYQFEESYKYIDQLIKLLVYDPNISSQIYDKINHYGQIKDDASNKLSLINKELANIDIEISNKCQQFINNNNDIMQEKIIAYRYNRACLLIKNQVKNTIKGFIFGQSASSLATYIEPEFLINLNNKKLSLINDKEIEIENILKELTYIIYLQVDSLIDNIHTIALLDSVFAKAKYGYYNNASLATLSNNNDLYLKDARHPLIDPLLVVANTYNIKSNYHLLLITGANTGGKSVALKTIGLFVIMTYLGIPILVEDAIIPLYDNIYIDINDGQSIVESLSSFSSHLKNIDIITRNITNKSLVLLDEIGNSTDPKDGEALSIAILDYLRNKQCLTICTTHYNGLKLYANKYDDILVGSVEFDYDSLRPTYKFLPNVIGSSNGLSIAEKYNILDEIISYAIKIKEDNMTNDEKLTISLEEKNIQYQQLLIDIQKEKQEIKNKEETLNNTIKQLEIDKQEIINQAKRQANEYLIDIQNKANMIIDDLKDQQVLKYHQGLSYNKQLESLIVDIQDSDNDIDINIDDYVKIDDSNNVGQVVDIEKNNIIVLINGIKVTTKKNKLTKVIKKQQSKINKTNKDIIIKSVPLELNIIGYKYDDAKELLIKYIDDILYANQSKCFIIHGIGSGVLKNMVHEYLKTHNSIKSYSLAPYNQGGNGATVVEFKK